MSRTVLVTGATGQLGRELVPLLRAAAIRCGSPAGPPPGLASTRPAGMSWTGPASGPGRGAVRRRRGGALRERVGERRAPDDVGPRRHHAGGPQPPHLVYISIVGVDRLPMFYYRAKLAAEQLLAGSGLPYSILRATQFHSLLAALTGADPVAGGPAAERHELPADLDGHGRRPAGRAGRRRTHARHREHRRSRGAHAAEPRRCGPDPPRRRKRIVEVPVPGKLAAALRAGHNLAPEHATPGQTFEEYLAPVAGPIAPAVVASRREPT